MQETKSGLTGATDHFLKFGAKSVAAIGTIVGAIVTVKKALDFSAEGAAFEQMGLSFEILTKKVGASTSLLEELRKASRGTVDDMSLMSSTALLLAGTTGELATALANATPELLEMAKVANKLNPALGDVTFLFDSLARGIKRGSPLILDNLGILVSLEEANEKYAASLGVAVNSLTEEQQKIALLNEVLGKGKTLLDQAGGTADSVTDEFGQMNTAWKNFRDEFAKGLKDEGVVTVVVQWITKGLENQSTVMEAVAAMKEAGEKGLWSQTDSDLYFSKGGYSVENYAKALDEANLRMEASKKASEEMANSYLDVAGSTDALGKGTRLLNNSFSDMIGPAGEAEHRIQAVGNVTKEAADNMDDFNDIAYGVGEAMGEVAKKNDAAWNSFKGMSDVISTVRSKMSGLGMESDAIDEVISRLSVSTGVLTQTEADMGEALDIVSEAWKMGLISYEQLLGYVQAADDGTLTLTGDMVALGQQVGATAEAIENGLGGALDKVDTGLGGKLKSMVEELRLLFVGGGPIFDVQAAFEQALTTAGTDPATIQSAQGLAMRIAAEFNQAMVDAKLMTPWEAQRDLEGTFPWLKGGGAAALMKEAGTSDLLPTPEELAALENSGKAFETIGEGMTAAGTSGAGQEIKDAGEGAIDINDSTEAGPNIEAMGAAFEEKNEEFKKGAENLKAIGQFVAPLEGHFKGAAKAAWDLATALDAIPDSFERTYTFNYVKNYITNYSTNGGPGDGPIDTDFGQSKKGKAAGGPVSAGMPYMVGEAGPEMFWPATNGNIIPNSQLPNLGGSTTNIITVTDRSAAALLAAHLAAASSQRFNDFMGG